MRLAPLIPLAFLLVPIAEIATFIVVGREIGVLATIGLLILAGLVGAVLLRVQGFRLIRAARADMAAGRMPADAIVHGAFLALAGLFLVLPGFLSDVVAFLLLLPPVRAGLVSLMKRSMTVVTSADGRTTRWTNERDPRVLDLEAVEVDRRDGDPASPWRGDEPPRLGG